MDSLQHLWQGGTDPQTLRTLFPGQFLLKGRSRNGSSRIFETKVRKRGMQGIPQDRWEKKKGLSMSMGSLAGASPATTDCLSGLRCSGWACPSQVTHPQLAGLSMV